MPKGSASSPWGLIQEAFHPIAPQNAQFEMKVEDFVKIISPLQDPLHASPAFERVVTRDLGGSRL